MQLVSSAFQNNGPIPGKYTCDGENINPPLAFIDVPEQTKSLALIMEDPDVPKSARPDGMWDHWIIWNIPAETRNILEGENPPGVLGANTRGDMNYGGPCPPDREHRYFFYLYALDSMLECKPGSSKAEVVKAMEGHILDQAELIGIYKRR